MRVPDANTAIVSQEKIVGYLLNPLHPDGAGKAAFFDALGFRADQWSVLADVLRNIIARSEATSRVDSAHGVKYIDGTIDTPSGRIVWIRTVWIVDAGASAPRLVTAYPRVQGA